LRLIQAKSSERIRDAIKSLVDELPALAKIKQGGTLNDEELGAVAGTLNQADLLVTEATLRKAYDNSTAALPDFLKAILPGDVQLDGREQRINKAFEQFIVEHGYLRAN
jgi:type I restriction enzyme, R subunit